MPNNAAIANYLINSQVSFDEVTGEERKVAGVYFYKEMDDLIDLARAISFDFFARPHMYDRLEDPAVVEALARLHARYGHHEKYLSRDQRQKLYEGIFAAGGNQFVGARDSLLYAAAKYSERVYDTGEEMLRASVRDAARRFKAYLTTLPGTSLSWSRDTALPGIAQNTSYRILRDGGIRAVFGQSMAVAVEWPFRVDGKGDEMVEVAAMQVDDPAVGSLNRDRFSAIQRLALRGAEAIATVIDYEDQPERDVVDIVILKCYTWHSALVQVEGAPYWASSKGSGNRPLELEDAGHPVMHTPALSSA